MRTWKSRAWRPWTRALQEPPRMAPRAKGGRRPGPDPADGARGAAPGAARGRATGRRARPAAALVTVAAPAPGDRSPRASCATSPAPTPRAARSSYTWADSSAERAGDCRAERAALAADRAAADSANAPAGQAQWRPAAPAGGHARGDAHRHGLARDALGQRALADDLHAVPSLGHQWPVGPNRRHPPPGHPRGAAGSTPVITQLSL